MPDILVSDIGMPNKDGYDLIREIRAHGISGDLLPAIALTAFARPEDRQQVLQAGFQMHISKPVDPGDFLEAIRNLIGSSLRAVANS